MALATSVTGSGKVIDGSKETGSYSYIITTIDEDVSGDPVRKQKQVTVTYTDERETLKWYALTIGAITDYMTANPTYNVDYTLENQYTNSYEMTKIDLTRTINSVTIIDVSE